MFLTVVTTAGDRYAWNTYGNDSEPVTDDLRRGIREAAEIVHHLDAEPRNTVLFHPVA